MRTTIVIPTCNRRRSLQRCLHSILRVTSEGDFEVVVVDDGSGDGTGRMVEGLSGKASFPVKYFRQDNRGAAAARNLGIENAEGSQIVFLDDDHTVGAGWLDTLCQPLSDPNVGIVNGRNLSVPDGGLAARYACLADERAEDQVAVTRLTHFISTNSAIRKEVLTEAGGFNEEFVSVFKGIVSGGEDTELGVRIRTKGYKIVYLPEAITDHYRTLSPTDFIKKRFNFGSSHVLWLLAEGRAPTTSGEMWKLFRAVGSTLLLPRSFIRFLNDSRGVLDSVGFALLDKISLVAYQAGKIHGVLTHTHQ